MGSGCGAVKAERALSEQTFTCEACGLVMDRDLKAAINLEHLAQAVYTARRREFPGDVKRSSRRRKTPSRERR